MDSVHRGFEQQAFVPEESMYLRNKDNGTDRLQLYQLLPFIRQIDTGKF